MKSSAWCSAAGLLLALCSAVPAAQWTVMVYMCADNGMSEQSYVDLAEMTRAGSTREVNVIVQVDRAEWDSLPRPVRYRVAQGSLELLGELPELDMADPQNLVDFVRFCRSSYRAEEYCLVLWDHGDGWPVQSDSGHARGPPGQTQRDTDTKGYPVIGSLPDWSGPGGSPPITSGILHDYSSNNWLGVAGGAFRRAMDGVRTALGRRCGVLVLDACLMQMLEVAHDAALGADLLLATEDLQPFNGLPYDTVLKVLAADPGLSARDFARSVPGLVVGSYSRGSQGEEAVTFSCLDLGGLDEASQALDDLLGQLMDRAGSEPVRAARRAVQTFGCEYPLPNRFNDNVDLIHLLELVRPLAPELADRARTRFEQAVLATASNDPVFMNARGIALWFPDNYLALKYRHMDYRGLDWASRVRWLEFLNCFFSSDDVRPTTPVITRVRRRDSNALELAWNRALDMAPVRYGVYEAGDTAGVFSDPAEDFANWENQGFGLTRTGDRTVFYSGSGDTLSRSLTLVAPIDLPSGGLISFQVLVNTREVVDSAGKFHRDVGYFQTSADSASWVRRDSFYGSSSGWRQCRYLLSEPGRYRMRFEYRTGRGPHVAGIAFDSIAVTELSGLRTVASGISDTAVKLRNHAQGVYQFAVVADDSFGNRSYLSQFAEVRFEDYARPYSVPAPVTSEECRLVGDWPAGMKPEVAVYTLAGELVRRFAEVEGRSVIWDCRNADGRPVASGVYLVVISGPGFRQSGVIARVR